MLTGWRYRVASPVGAVALTIGAVLLANHSVTQHVFTTYVPLVSHLEATTLAGASLVRIVSLTALAVFVGLIPLYKPRPRRVLDTVSITLKRVLSATLALATVGFFDWSHRVPRSTLLITFLMLSVALPAWFVWIRRRPVGQSGRALIVGDDPEQIESVAGATALPLLGYLCPTSVMPSPESEVQIEQEPPKVIADGGVMGIERLGGLSRLEDVLVEYDVDTVVLAFHQPDRAEFFGALDACHEHGVAAKVHREYADSVLVDPDAVGRLVDVNIDPIDPQDYIAKRIFDVAFAGLGLLFLAPLLVVIAVAIKVDSPGPVLYQQKRTAGFGETFTVSKFRSMVTDAEAESGAKISEEDAGGVDPRVTRVGLVLRKTHLDEIPQLWSILVGDMSVVGPRPERPEIDQDIQEAVAEWQKRWFIKPGLTGLAQIHNVTGHEPAQKLNYDVKYIKQQSFIFDLKIVIRQIWAVLSDISHLCVFR